MILRDWKYNPEDYNPDGYGLIPPGEYRVRIDEAKEAVSKTTQKDMFQLVLSVSGYNKRLWFYLVFDSSDEFARQRTNQKLGSIYDSFNIPAGNMNLEDWIGKTGGAKIKHRLGNDEQMREEISYFLPRKKVDKLPAWEEKFQKKSSASAPNTGTINPEAFNPESNDLGLTF